MTTVGDLRGATDTEIRHHERIKDGVYFEATSKSSFIFGKIPRNLEIRLYQPKIDEIDDSFEDLSSPLQVVLIEDDGEMKYEDIYYFTPDNVFLRHGWRKSNEERYINANGEENKRKHFDFDANQAKLYEYGEQIAKMLKENIMHPSLEYHPTIKKLKTHTLWEL